MNWIAPQLINIWFVFIPAAYRLGENRNPNITTNLIRNQIEF